MMKAKEMPVTSSQLHRLMKSKHSYIERHLSSAVSIIRHSMQTSAAFEATVQHLKERYMETVSLACTNLMISTYSIEVSQSLYGDYYESLQGCLDYKTICYM